MELLDQCLENCKMPQTIMIEEENKVMCIFDLDKPCPAACPFRDLTEAQRVAIVRKSISAVWDLYDVGIDDTYEELGRKLARRIESQIPNGGCMRG